jgi:hypothetical protein
MQLGGLQNLRSIAELLCQYGIIRMVDQVLRVAKQLANSVGYALDRLQEAAREY